MAALVGCNVEGTIESCTPDGGYMVELRAGFHVMRGARSAAICCSIVRASSCKAPSNRGRHLTVMVHLSKHVKTLIQFLRGRLSKMSHIRAGLFQSQLAVTATVPEARFLGGTRALPPGGPRRRHSMSTADFSTTSLWDAERPRLAAPAVPPAAATVTASYSSPWLAARQDLSPLGGGPSAEAMVSTRFHAAAVSQHAATADGASMNAQRLRPTAEVGVPCWTCTLAVQSDVTELPELRTGIFGFHPSCEPRPRR